MLKPSERSKPLNRLIYTTFNSPLGKTGVAVTPYGICRVVLSIKKESEFIESLKTIYHSPKKQRCQLTKIEKEFHLYFNLHFFTNKSLPEEIFTIGFEYLVGFENNI